VRQTDYVILGLLSESPLTGYQIKKLIDVRFRFFWSESYGQIFPALKALCASGMTEEIETGDEKKRSQKTYRITELGHVNLRQWLMLPVERESVRLEILLKMYFSHLTDNVVMLDHVLKFQEAHKQDLQILNLFENELKKIVDDDENHPRVLRVIDFGRKVNEAYLDWCRETILFLENGERHETEST
jgi:PadR family transcriptional regulator AphA